MSFPPLHPSQNSLASSSDSKLSNSGSARPRQSAWGLPAQSSSRRGLTPLATNVPSSAVDPSGPRPGSSSGPSSNSNIASPFAPTFSSVLNSSSGRLGASGRHLSSASTTSPPPLASFQTGSQQLSANQSLSSPRSRANTPFSSSNLASSAANSTTASQGGGGGGGGGSIGGGGQSKSAVYSPALSSQGVTSPTASTFERSPFGSSNQLSSSHQSSVSKIVVTQVFLLLGSITEKEGKAKWESQAEAIRKLVDSHGMEVFAKYFRRLIVGNSPQIFPGINRNVENPGNYPLLVDEIGKAASDSQQAQKIADIIDTSEGDIYRDFDLVTFITHFNLDPVEQTILTSAFTQVTKADLRSKATSLLSSTFHPLRRAFETLGPAELDGPPTKLATAAFRILLDLPSEARDGSERQRITQALETTYMKQDLQVPLPIRSAMALADIMGESSELAQELMKYGPSATASLDNARTFIRRYSKNHLDAAQIGTALLFLTLNPDASQYHSEVFVAALREQSGLSVSWQTVLRSFDREGLVISPEQFLTLYRALAPIAAEDSSFDIQLLWGGEWQHKPSQLSFAAAFASLSSAQLDAATIPNLRLAFDPREWTDIPEEFATLAEATLHDPMISLDAVVVILDALDEANQFSAQYPQHLMTWTKSVVQEKMSVFLSAAGGVPKPWNSLHQSLMSNTVTNCLDRKHQNSEWILHCLWKQERSWLASRFMEIHSEDPLLLPLILEHAMEQNWLDDLLTMVNGLGIDLAALAHRRGIIDIHQWANEKLERTPPMTVVSPEELTSSLARFLNIKAQDEIRSQRHEQPTPRTVTLAMKTVHAMLEIMEEHMKNHRDELLPLERQCMQAFPRLCNYGEGFDEIIEANGAERNTLPEAADVEMQELYKKMYSSELEVRHVIEALRDCKTSEDPSRQDLFACMIHGLFDEYVCFNEYPLNPLATTAVLFGGIINYRLINNFALNVGLEMVLEAVREYSPESSMFKFGLQALLHFLGRLQEWPEYCQDLVQVPGLQGTPAYGPAQDALRGRRNSGSRDRSGPDGQSISHRELNGNLNDLISHDSLVPQFRSVNADPPPNPDELEDPEEDVQDKVLFVLNNVSEQNLSSKISEITDALEPRHYQWFASYLVEQRAKSQPNYQQLYLDLLGKFGDKHLWADVLRETYVSVRKVLNAESTMKNAVERTYLKNLGTWLGSLTIARDKPIKHKNIAFKELLIEGWETQRLLLVIPFTCEVLAQGTKSVVFKPPNPWIMEIIGLLLELYDLPDLKIQQKFAVEVLLAAFGLPRNGEKIPRSTELKKRQERFEAEMAEPMIPDGLEAFDDLAIGTLNRGVRNARLSPTAIASSLPDISNMLVFPPASSSPVNHARLRQVVQNAVQRSIMEIIGPVVERSVTIATIATKDLVVKDYAQEGDEERLREAFENVAKATSGSLASVTCKEPLRMSITNYIRNAASEMPDQQPLPEGAILMCVNDNLEIACKIVERQAEEKALPEIKAHIEVEIAKRREHKANFPNEPYRDPATSHWSSYIPEPYKQMPGGLNQQQLDIYQNFAPQARGINHNQTASTDSGKQIPDVLQDAGFPNIPNLSTPAEAAAVPHQPQPQLPQGNLPLALANARTPSQVNGYMDGASIQEHMHDLLGELRTVAREHPYQKFRDLARNDPVIDILARMVTLVRTSPDVDSLALQTASFVYQLMYTDSDVKFVVELFVQVLKQLCQASPATFTKLSLILQKAPDDKIMNVPVTTALLEVGLMEYPQVDLAFERALRERNLDALQAFCELLDSVLFCNEPLALRADFAISLGAMGEWLSESPNLELAKEIVAKLKSAGVHEPPATLTDQGGRLKQEQLQYVFQEWLTLFNHPSNHQSSEVAFVNQVHKNQLLHSKEDLALFLRLAIESAADFFESNVHLNPNVDPNEAHFQTDALARFIIISVKNQGKIGGNAKQSKSSYMRSILFLLVLILNNQHVMRGERFSQRTFFRLFSTIFYDWHQHIREVDPVDDRNTILGFAETLLLLGPHFFPAFTYGWLSLISHRVFMPAILKNFDTVGSDIFAKLMEAMLSYVSGLLKTNTSAGVARDLYRGVLRILLILHHDFPEFLAENHYRLCNVIPAQCTQLRNLVLSAFPSSIFELPDPFSHGLKVDRLDDIRKAPTIAGDVLAPLDQAGIKNIVDSMLKGSTTISDETIGPIMEALQVAQNESAQDIDPALAHSLVLYIGQSAISSSSSNFKTTPTFSNESPHAILMSKLVREAHPETRYHLINAVANQLRYPNSHTHFFSYALLHLFGTDQADQQESDIRQQITRVLLERLIVHRPHPWGLIITLLELLKNPVYQFWELPFIKAAPEIEKLFGALFSQINHSQISQSPRPLV